LLPGPQTIAADAGGGVRCDTMVAATIRRLAPGCREQVTGSDQDNRCRARFRGLPMLAPVEKTAGRDPAMLIVSPET